MRGAFGTVVLIAAALIGVPVQDASAVDPSCGSSSPDSALVEALPWAQEMYDPANKLRPFSTGRGIVVAVVDSGVDPTHPQMLANVLPGIGYVPGFPTGSIDCVPHGTGVASIIAAQPLPGYGFVGLAPEATILPVRVSDQTYVGPAEQAQDPATLAAGIDYAVTNGARVVAVSTVCYCDTPELEAAAAKALAAGVVVVAAVGDGQSGDDNTPSPLVPYPAGYPGVIGVGAVDRDGARATFSQIGSYVDLLAPGVDVIAAGFAGHQPYDGTGIAVGFVAATAALLLAQPDSDLTGLSGPLLVNRLSSRLLGSADGTSGGSEDLGYGSGILDPYRALTESLVNAPPVEVDGHHPPPPDEAALRLAAQRDAANAASLRNAVLVIALALSVLAAAFFLPRARLRRWRPGREREMQKGRDDKQPEFLPGEMLFGPTPKAPARK